MLRTNFPRGYLYLIILAEGHLMIHNLMRPPRLPTPFSIIALSSGNFTNSEMNIKNDYGKNSGVEWHRKDMRGRQWEIPIFH